MTSLVSLATRRCCLGDLFPATTAHIPRLLGRPQRHHQGSASVRPGARGVRRHRAGQGTGFVHGSRRLACTWDCLSKLANELCALPLGHCWVRRLTETEGFYNMPGRRVIQLSSALSPWLVSLADPSLRYNIAWGCSHSLRDSAGHSSRFALTCTRTSSRMTAVPHFSSRTPPSGSCSWAPSCFRWRSWICAPKCGW